MKNILTDDGRSVLEVVARERMLLAFDFDGTLAPLCDEPATDRMPDSTRALLRLASLLHPCAVISGRSRADLVPRLDGIPLVAIVGNHGAEAGNGPVDRTVREAVVSWREMARSRLEDVQGVEIEDKGLSLAIHYRRAPFQDSAERAVTAAALSLEGARVFPGHSVVNVVPSEAHDKGLALSRILSRIGGTRALYVGDDTSDEDAFRSEAVHVAVRVGRSAVSAAGYFVPKQPDVDDLLRAIARTRRRLDGMDERTEGLERMLER